jgi:hypothetical protein
MSAIWHWYLLAYVIAGYLLDRMCKWETKRQNKPYRPTLVLMCYTVGPIMVIVWIVSWPVNLFFKKRE